MHAVIAVAASSRTVTLQSSDPLPHSHGLGCCTLKRVAARQLEKNIMAKTAQQLIKVAFEAAKTMPPATAELLKDMATMLDVSNVTLRQARKERDAMKEEVISWAKECDRIVERHTKTRSNMHVLEAMRDMKNISAASTSDVEAV